MQRCSIRGAKDAAKYKEFILPLIFTKRLRDVFDDELNRIAKEVGSRAKAFSPTDLLRTPVCQAAAYRQFLAARTGLEQGRRPPVDAAQPVFTCPAEVSLKKYCRGQTWLSG
jgi:hypothetical protein